jgi:hypothetical protein
MGTEKQQKHTVSIIFLFTSEGHEAIWEYCFSGRLAFSQDQIATHKGKVYCETFAPVPWSFLTKPDTNSHRHSLVPRPLPQFLGVFPQGQMPTHTGKVSLLSPTLAVFSNTEGN